MGWIRWIRLWRRISSQISDQGINGPLKCLIYCWTPSKGKTFLVRFSDGHCQTTPTNWCYETLENKPIKPEETRFDIARKLGPRFLIQKYLILAIYTSLKIMKNLLEQKFIPRMFQKLSFIAKIFTIVPCLGGILMMCEDILVWSITISIF